MVLGAALILLLLLTLLVVLLIRGTVGGWCAIAMGALMLLGCAWCVRHWAQAPKSPPHDDRTAAAPITSQTCIECHQSRHASWYRTFHRTMTREATPEYVKANFDSAEHRHLGVTTRMVRQDDRFFMDTVDPVWAAQMGQRGIPLEDAGTPTRRRLSIDRVVGSHWFQQFLHRDEAGRYIRLPMAYHIVEDRWIHIDGAFLAPVGGQFFSKIAVWNQSCIFCHNTRPSPNPVPLPGQSPSFRTKVAELGISCEACHGASESHVRAHAGTTAAQDDRSEADPTIVNPARLSVARSDDICAHCHGGTMPRFEAWDRVTSADPFLAGQELRQFWHLPRSEAEQRLLETGHKVDPTRPPAREPLDGRFWGDGTPLTTALEYQGMAMSACYQGGHGKMSCLTCHAMHGGDPNHQLKKGMRTNAACYQCHESYQNKLVEHTHHAAGSPGSLCQNCHMPYLVYSLLDTHRSHRIEVPHVRDSLGTGKPHACNLCHLDKSLGWTQEQLGKWYSTRPEPLPDDERTIASSVLHLARGDARSRAVVAGAFALPAAHQASGREWAGLVLAYTLEHERYQAVRYTTHKSLRALHGKAANDYDFQGEPAKRAEQLRLLRLMLQSAPRPDPKRYPYLPLGKDGLFSAEEFKRLLKARSDPDVFVNE